VGQEYLQPFPWGMQGHFQSPQLRACLSLTKTFPGTAAVEWSLEFGAVGVGEVGQKAARRQRVGSGVWQQAACLCLSQVGLDQLHSCDFLQFRCR